MDRLIEAGNEGLLWVYRVARVADHRFWSILGGAPPLTLMAIGDCGAIREVGIIPKSLRRLGTDFFNRMGRTETFSERTRQPAQLEGANLKGARLAPFKRRHLNWPTALL